MHTQETALIKAMDAIMAQPEQATSKVIIEVRGGVAEVTQCPEGVSVDIIDYDNH